MRDNVKGGALTEVTFYILLSLYTPKHGYAVMQFIRPENDTLLVEVETKSGTIAIEMKDADGNVIFSESDIATSSFEVDVPEKLTIRVDADMHKGGFSFE